MRNKTSSSSSVTQLCPTLCDPMNCRTPGLPVHHQLLESAQTHVHWVSDAIQSSHRLSSPSPPALNLSQHQGLFKWVSSPHQMAKVLELQLQHQSFQWTPRTDLLQDELVGSPCSPRDSQESSPIPQFKIISSSVLSFLYRVFNSAFFNISAVLLLLLLFLMSILAPQFLHGPKYKSFCLSLMPTKLFCLSWCLSLFFQWIGHHFFVTTFVCTTKINLCCFSGVSLQAHGSYGLWAYEILYKKYSVSFDIMAVISLP